jgi:hypothetical protein
VRVPAPKHIKDLFEGLLGRDVSLGDGVPVPLDARPRPTTAVYVNDNHALSAVALMDFPLTAYSGAALALLPKGGAEDAIDEKDLPPILLENAAELLNVLAAPIGDASGVHQRLHQTFGPDQLPPSDVSAWSARLGSRLDVELDIKGYGKGTLSVVSTLP